MCLKGAQPSGPEKGKATWQVDPGKPQRRVGVGEQGPDGGTVGLPSSQADGRGESIPGEEEGQSAILRSQGPGLSLPAWAPL